MYLNMDNHWDWVVEGQDNGASTVPSFLLDRSPWSFMEPTNEDKYQRVNMKTRRILAVNHLIVIF